jgi:hypothetical protein
MTTAVAYIGAAIFLLGAALGMLALATWRLTPAPAPPVFGPGGTIRSDLA